MPLRTPSRMGMGLQQTKELETMGIMKRRVVIVEEETITKIIKKMMEF